MFVLVLQMTYLDLGSNNIVGSLPDSWDKISASSIFTVFAMYLMQCFFVHMHFTVTEEAVAKDLVCRSMLATSLRA